MPQLTSHQPPWFRRPFAARTAWGAVALLCLLLTLLALPAHYHQYSTLSLFGGEDERRIARESLAQFGLSPAAFAWYAVGFQALQVVVSFAIAVTIVRAKSDGMALFVSALLMAIAAERTLFVTPETETWGWPVALVTAAAHAGFILFFYLFPEGRFAPHWTRWVALLWGAVLVPPSLFPSAWFGLRNWPVALYLLVLAGVLTTGVAAQVYRYRRVAGPVARQQIKWVLYGAAKMTFIALAFGTLDAFERPHTVRAVLNPAIGIHEIAGIAVGNLALLSIPLSVGIAVLRYHLWDIDLVISRTLVYVPLSAIVTGIYVASSTLCQRALLGFTGQQQSDMAIVLIALLVTALITPLNLAAQRFVDRRFKEPARSLAKLMKWGDDIASAVYNLNGYHVIQRLLEEAGDALRAEGGAAYVTEGGRPYLVHRYGHWTGSETHVTIPLESGDVQLGVLQLGERQDGLSYRPHELKALRQTAEKIARALHQRSDLQPHFPADPSRRAVPYSQPRHLRSNRSARPFSSATPNRRVMPVAVR